MVPKRIWANAEYRFYLTSSGHRNDRMKGKLPPTAYEIDEIKIKISRGKSGSMEIQGNIRNQSAVDQILGDLKLEHKRLPTMELRESEPYGQDWCYGSNFVIRFRFDASPDYKKMSIDQVVDILYGKLTKALGVADINPGLCIQESFLIATKGRRINRADDFTRKFLHKKKFSKSWLDSSTR